MSEIFRYWAFPCYRFMQCHRDVASKSSEAEAWCFRITNLERCIWEHMLKFTAVLFDMTRPFKSFL
jgi:hypothetical protein